MDVTNSHPPGQYCSGGYFTPYTSASSSKGLTLIELLVVLAIASILFGMTLPGISSILATNRLTSQINLLSGAMAYTRSVAILHNQAAVICKSLDGQNCDTKAKWEDGWIIYFDKDGDRTLDTNNGDEILRIQAALTATTLRYKAFGPRGYIAYQGRWLYPDQRHFYSLCKKQAKDKKSPDIIEIRPPTCQSDRLWWQTTEMSMKRR